MPGTERTPGITATSTTTRSRSSTAATLYGIPMPPGLVSHAPQGVHHGAPEKARERARRKFDEYDRVDWSVIAGRHPPPAGAVSRGPGQRSRSGIGARHPRGQHCDHAESPVKHEYDRIPYLVAYQNNRVVRDVYGGVAELVVLESYLLKPKTKPSDTVLVFMHPIGGGAYLPMINALARAGHHVIYCNSRFRGTDSALLMEKVVEDLGECIKDAKNRLGYAKVVLAGWSGGGSLSVFYQQQAQHPTVTASPSGDGPDLTKLGLIPADAIMLLAAHVSRHGTMTEWMDASILDETDPDEARSRAGPLQPRQPEPAAVHAPSSWTATAQAQIAPQPADHRRGSRRSWPSSRPPGAPDDEFAFVVHGTMADPRWLDPTVDPNERTPGTCYLGDPQVVNNSPVGLARFCTLRSWLSQWSYDDANGDAVHVRTRHRGARAGDRQPRRRRLHARATPGGCSRRSGIRTRRCTRSPAPTTTTPGRTSATRCAEAVGIVHRLAAHGTGSAAVTDDTGRPLDGIRVIEVGTLISGPFAGRLLGDMGAEVIKIEPPGVAGPVAHLGAGRTRRPPLLLDGARPQQEGRHAEPARAKPAGSCSSTWSSAPTSSSRTSGPARWRSGTSVTTCCANAIAASSWSGCPATGRPGPEAHKAGYASVAEAASGLRHMNGFPGGPPPRLALSLGDSLAGMFAAQGALAALYRRTVTGEGQVVDAALTESCLAVQESTIPDYDVGGVVRGPSGTRLEGIAPSNIYRTADGSWVVIAANQDTVFRRLCAAMGQPELATDDRFANHVARGRNQDELDKIIGDWAAERQPADIIATLSAAGVISRADQHRRRGGRGSAAAGARHDRRPLRRADRADRHGPRRGAGAVGDARHASATPVRPRPGQHNDEIYRGLLGKTDDEIDDAADGGRAMTELPAHVDIREVSLRDGLQIEDPIPLSAKLELLAAVAATGVREMEATAFVSPSKVPALADAAELAAELHKLRRHRVLRAGGQPERRQARDRGGPAARSSTWCRRPTGTAAPTSGAPPPRRPR